MPSSTISRCVCYAVLMILWVHSFSLYLVEDDLGCKVVWRPTQSVSPLVGHHLCEAKVCHLDEAFPVQQQILWLQQYKLYL